MILPYGVWPIEPELEREVHTANFIEAERQRVREAERRARRMANRKDHLYPVIYGVVMALCIMAALWGSTP